MKVKQKNPILKQLSVQEMKDINGGSDNNTVSMNMYSSTNSLLSMEFKWQQGSNYQDYKISAGNNINLGVNGINS